MTPSLQLQDVSTVRRCWFNRPPSCWCSSTAPLTQSCTPFFLVAFVVPFETLSVVVESEKRFYSPFAANSSVVQRRHRVMEMSVAQVARRMKNRMMKNGHGHEKISDTLWRSPLLFWVVDLDFCLLSVYYFGDWIYHICMHIWSVINQFTFLSMHISLLDM